MKKTFVDENINIFEGTEAEKLLSNKNDKKYLIENVGVLKVDDDRWAEAQKFERKTWCDSPAKNMGTDRNEFHESHFSDYSQLNIWLNKNNINVIELGCGPFTNLRLILPKIYKNVKQVDLLDPLIFEYIKHTTNCTYKNGFLNSHSVNLIESPIEKFEPTNKYDLIVMINVIEHCYDLDLIIKKIVGMANNGAIFLFHDKFLSKENVNSIHDRYYDSGHPLKMRYDYVKLKFAEYFSVISSKLYTNENDELCVYQIMIKR